MLSAELTSENGTEYARLRSAQLLLGSICGTLSQFTVKTPQAH